MAVIREDVVSIGFEVENNPFGELTLGINDIKAKLGILDETTSDLKEVTSEAKAAGNGLQQMSNGIHAPPGLDDAAQKTKALGDQAKKTELTFTGLVKDMAKAGKTKLDTGVKKLSDGIKKPVTGMKNLADSAKQTEGNVKKIGLPHALNTGLGKAFVAAGKLASGLKAAAGVGFGKTVGGLKSLAAEAGKASGALAKGAVKGAGKLAVGISAGIAVAGTAMVGLGTAAVSVGSGFEASMSQVAATMGMTADEANYSNETYTKLANTAKEMGAATKFSAAESAEALNYMALAGYDADKACSALPTVLNLAAAGGMELASASDMVTDSMSALGIEATQQNLTQFGDQLAKTAQKSNTSVAQLGEAVLTVGGTAKTLSGGTTELNTLLGIIADNGVKGAEGGTALRNIMLSLQAPTDTAAKKMKALGLNVYDAQGKMRPMNEILGDLNNSMGKMTDQQKQDVLSTIFNKNDLKSVNALLANSGARFDELSGYVKDSDGAMASMAETMNNNLTGKITEFKSAMEGAGIEIYEALGSGNLKGFVETATGWVNELTAATKEGGIKGLVSQVGETFSHIVTTISGYIPDFVDSGVEIINSLIDGIMKNEGQITDSITKGILSLGKGVIKIAPKLVVTGVAVIASLRTGIVKEIPSLIPLCLEAGKTLSNGFIQYGPQILNAGIKLIGFLFNGLIQAIPSLIGIAVTVVTTLLQGIIGNLDLLIDGALALVNSLVNGLIVNLPLILSSAAQLVTGLVTGIANNAGNLIDGSIALIQNLLTGLISNLPAIIGAAVQIVVALAGGLIQAVPQLIAAVPKLISAIVDTVMATDWLQLGKDIVKGIGSGFTNGIKGAFGKNKEGGKEAIQSIAEGMDEGSALTRASAELTSKDITTKVDSTNLYGSGQNIMSGLNSGMLSMQGTLNTTAGNIGSGISANLNKSLDIHSPSRVTEETGKYTDLGLIKGMEGMSGRVETAARNVGDVTAKNIAPYKSRYSPETSQSVNNTSSSNQVNNWNPSFNLTLNGASASDSNERKVKRWVKESIKESVESMGRTNPRLQEV